MRIYWTKKSENRFQEIYTYILTEFGDKSSKKFKDKVFDFLELLERFPELGTWKSETKTFTDFKYQSRQEYSTG
ncbi:type II toxin-antitoxin system RelE/ParE family toxin [Ekhidna sp.]|uniref:type II toxin-antitoxin system RelE/ParE family toxin n=1 Tax=Ekhidna sp. TaxID=2608089 RepID=UPI003B5ABFC7